MTNIEGTMAIVGDGNVGRALATRMLASGMTVRFGVRSPGETPVEKPDDALSQVPRVSIADAVRDADMVWLTVPAAAAVQALSGAPLRDGQLVVDCTNPVTWDNGPVLAPPPEGSVAAQLAAAYPGARVVKSFNHFGAEIHADPVLSHGPADVFVAGDDSVARARVIDVANAMGFMGCDAGPLRNASLLENLAVLWIHLATVGGQGRQFAFVRQPRD